MYLLPNQADRYDADEFLKDLRMQYPCKYSEIMHAPAHERKERFRREFEEGRVKVAFSNGIGPVLILSAERRYENGKYLLVAQPFVFNGVLVVARGYIDETTLEGRLKIEKVKPPEIISEPSVAQMNEMDRLCALYNVSNT